MRIRGNSVANEMVFIFTVCSTRFYISVSGDGWISQHFKETPNAKIFLGNPILATPFFAILVEF